MAELKWSEERTEQTREVLQELFDGKFTGRNCNMKKRIDDGTMYGYIENRPQLMNRPPGSEIVISETEEDRTWVYYSINEIIDDGWAVD